MLDIDAKQLEMVKKILQEHVPNMVVWAYGSRVEQRSHAASDLDLVVINEKNPTQEQAEFAKLREAFSESNLPILVDVMDWARIPDAFKQQIKQNYVLIQK